MISKSNVKFTDSNVKFTDSNVKFTDSNVKFTDSEVRMASAIQQEIEKLLKDKDSMILSLEMHLTFLHLIVL